MALSDEMTRLLAPAQAFAELTDGAFDITYAAVGQLYDYRNRTRPSSEALARAQARVGFRHLLLDVPARTGRFERAGMRIEPEVATGLSIPVVLVLVAYGLRRVHSRIITEGSR